MELNVILLGVAFGMVMQRARLNTFDVIGGFAVLEDYTGPKVLLTAVGLGAVLINPEVLLGGASWQVKPFLVGGVVAGGLLFGCGLAVLGYCPASMLVALGEGWLDAGVGLMGGLVGGLAYMLGEPYLASWLGPNMGALDLAQLVGLVGWRVMFLAAPVGALCVALAFVLDRPEPAA